MKINNLHNKKIAILWFWKEGQSTLSFLKNQGIEDITILDGTIICLEDASIKHIVGDTYLDNLEEYDIIIKSPGISPFQEKILPYREKIISQTQIFFSNYEWKVIGITGTKGKSTISILLYECLKAAWYNVKLVGNIGTPVLQEIPFYSSSTGSKRGEWKKDYDYVIYELSSYMLQDFTPELEIGFLNNIYPCHLDWHYDSFNIYREAKLNILKNTKNLILHGDLASDAEVLDIKEKKIFFDTKGEYSYDSTSFFLQGVEVYSWEVKVLWEHNRKNITGVLAILDQIVEKKEDIADIFARILPTFWWLPNRIEDIWVYEGIRYINDAIATTPQSTIAAINTFWSELQTLFLWWEDSWFDFSELRKAILQSSIQNIIAFPDTSKKIFPEIEPRDYEIAFEIEIEGKSLQFIKTRFMKQWVDFCYKTTLPWKTALLSCAAPSFSLWKSYTEKAQEFVYEVQQY